MDDMSLTDNDKGNLSRDLWQGRYILAPFVPTPSDIVDRMLKLADVSARDYVIDLGCGDGRILIRAAEMYGARGMGVDIEPYYVTEAQRNARLARMDELVTFKLQDALTTDISQATVVMLYLVEWSTQKIKLLINQNAKSGTRIVSHNYDMGDWKTTKTEIITDSEGKGHKLYLWTLN